MRILISSKNTVVPKGIQLMLNSSVHTILSHYYQCVEQLIAKAILERADLVILDKDDGKTFTFSEISQLRKRLPRLRILLISTVEHLNVMQDCYTGDIEGCVTYDCSEEELAEAVQTIEKGGRFFCRRILTELLPRMITGSGNEEYLLLTARELEIARAVADGFTNKQIAERLCISPHTVHTHRKSVMKKLRISSAREVALVMLSYGK